MNTILSWALKLGLLNKVLKPMAVAYAKTKGFRTQGLLALAGAYYVGGFFGWIPMDEAMEKVSALLVAAIPTLADKVKDLLLLGSTAAKKLDGMQEPAQ